MAAPAATTQDGGWWPVKKLKERKVDGGRAEQSPAKNGKNIQAKLQVHEFADSPVATGPIPSLHLQRVATAVGDVRGTSASVALKVRNEEPQRFGVPMQPYRAYITEFPEALKEFLEKTDLTQMNLDTLTVKDVRRKFQVEIMGRKLTREERREFKHKIKAFLDSALQREAITHDMQDKKHSQGAPKNEENSTQHATHMFTAKSPRNLQSGASQHNGSQRNDDNERNSDGDGASESKSNGKSSVPSAPKISDNKIDSSNRGVQEIRKRGASSILGTPKICEDSKLDGSISFGQCLSMRERLELAARAGTFLETSLTAKGKPWKSESNVASTSRKWSGRKQDDVQVFKSAQDVASTSHKGSDCSKGPNKTRPHIETQPSVNGIRVPPPHRGRATKGGVAPTTEFEHLDMEPFRRLLSETNRTTWRQSAVRQGDVQFPEHFPPSVVERHAAHCNTDLNFDNTNILPANDEELIECPLCYKHFHQSYIQVHANLCADKVLCK